MTQTEQPHTPGPWKAYRSAVQDATGRIILTQSWTNKLTDDQYTDAVKRALRANALAVAAVWDLLEALIVVMTPGALQHQPDCDSVAFGEEFCDCGCMERVQLAYDAIAKAQRGSVLSAADVPGSP